LTKQEYTSAHTYKLNLNELVVKIIKNFEFQIQYIRVTSGNLNDSGSESLDDTRATPCLKMPPLEAVYTYGVSQYRVQPSGVWTSH
jgi:hypothetical protein